jgi:hypothetical protein
MSELTTEKVIQKKLWTDSDGVYGDSEDRVTGSTDSLPDKDGQADGWMSVVGS